MSLFLTYKVSIFQFYYSAKSAIIASGQILSASHGQWIIITIKEKAMKATFEGEFNRFGDREVLALIEKAAGRSGKPATMRERLVLWLGRYRQRRQMARDLNSVGFTDTVLKDFGLTRQQAEKEAAKHFWQA
jgi:uncharacterized protein YjiS (DUF1127 family)